MKQIALRLLSWCYFVWLKSPDNGRQNFVPYKYNFSISYFHLNLKKIKERCVFNLKYLGQNLVKLHKYVGDGLKLSEPADFKNDPGFDCQRFVGVLEQNIMNFSPLLYTTHTNRSRFDRKHIWFVTNINPFVTTK